MKLVIVLMVLDANFCTKIILISNSINNYRPQRKISYSEELELLEKYSSPVKSKIAVIPLER